jgi:hypothetical protein
MASYNHHHSIQLHRAHSTKPFSASTKFQTRAAAPLLTTSLLQPLQSPPCPTSYTNQITPAPTTNPFPLCHHPIFLPSANSQFHSKYHSSLLCPSNNQITTNLQITTNPISPKSITKPPLLRSSPSSIHRIKTTMVSLAASGL